MTARFVPVALLLLTTASCATLFNADTKPVAMGSNPTGSEVWIDNVRRGTTPISIDLGNHHGHTIVFRKEGHQDAVCELKASVGAGWVILDVLGGLIPVIVDAATGAWKSLDAQTCNVSLLKEPGEASVPKGKARAGDPKARG